MSKNSSSINISGLFSTLLIVLFIYLKLTEQINWSWVWVLSPLWISAIFVILIIIIFILFTIIIKRI